MSSYRRQIFRFLEDAGAWDISVFTSAHGHPQLCWIHRGVPYRVGISSSPSDQNAATLKIAELKRVMGLAWGPSRRGVRRRRRERRCHRATACPRLSALPDWREPLYELRERMRHDEKLAA